MPVKNAGSYLKPCIESIISQSFKDWELIAINDHSTDGSEEVLKEYQKHRANIKLFNSNGHGIVAALRLAYKKCSGDVIHRMDADDLMPENKLELMNGALVEGTVVTGQVSYFCDERELGNGFNQYAKWINEAMESNNFWSEIYKECVLPSSAWMMYRSDFERIGRFDSDFMPEDYDLCFRVYKYGLNVQRIPQVVHYWRDSANRTSRSEEVYFPMSYFHLKTTYFLDIDRKNEVPLVLWGAGKKGKSVAKLLIDSGEEFLWITDNEKKAGHNIYGKVLVLEGDLEWTNCQTIIALSSPKDKIDIKNRMNASPIVLKNVEFFWFC